MYIEESRCFHIPWRYVWKISYSVRIDDDTFLAHSKHTNSKDTIHPVVTAWWCFELKSRKPFNLILREFGGWPTRWINSRRTGRMTGEGTLGLDEDESVIVRLYSIPCIESHELQNVSDKEVYGG